MSSNPPSGLHPAQSFVGNSLTHGAIGGHLLRMTLPMVWGILAMLSKNLVDTYFVSQLGTDKLTAISFTFPVVFAVMSLAIGLGAGTASVVARAIGQGETSVVKRRATDALVLALSLVAVMAVVGVATIRPIFAAMGAKGAALEGVVQYMTVWYAGIIFLVVPLVGSSIIRASGDAYYPSLIMIGAAGCNLALDPFLIFGWGPFPRLEITGAALATVISNVFALCGMLYLLVVKRRLISWSIPSARDFAHSIRHILRISVPASAANMINPIGIAILTAVLARYGDTTVAGFGVATRIEGFAIVGMLALSASVGPVVGQNWGAGAYQRVHETVALSSRACLIMGLVLAAVLALTAPWLTAAFDDSKTVQDIANRYLWTLPITFAGYGVTIVVSASFNAVGWAFRATAITLLRMAGLYLPGAHIGGWLAGPQGIFIAGALANVVSGALAYSWIAFTCQARHKETGDR